MACYTANCTFTYTDLIKIFMSCAGGFLVYFAGCQDLALVLLCTVFCRYKGLGGSVFLWCQIPICTAPSQTAVAFRCWQSHGATNCRLRQQPCYFRTRTLLFRRTNNNNNNTWVAARWDAERWRWTAAQLPANRDFWCAAIRYFRRCPSATLRWLIATINNRLHGCLPWPVKCTP